MPDISMCMNVGCHLRDRCYRFRAISSMRQSFAGFKPDDDGNCEHFWDIGYSESQIRSTEEAEMASRRFFDVQQE